MSLPDAESAMEKVLTDRTDLDQYKNNKRLLFAIELILGVDDIHEVAQRSLTDGRGDRSCDLVHVDREQGLVIVAQAYEAISRSTVEERKVRDLYQAVNHVFSAPIVGLPIMLSSAIDEVRAAIEDGSIRHVDLWFVHNCATQRDLTEALEGSAIAVRNALKASFPEIAADMMVSATQLSRPALAEWFESYQIPIRVTDTIRVPVGQCLVEKGSKWTGYLASVPLDWLQQQFWAYEDHLFSGNVRGYLGRVNTPYNINNGIRTTLREEPTNFWIYNNGVTALVRGAELTDDGEELVIEGLSIVNGAQTTGALHRSADLAPLDEAKVMVRFIVCEDPTIIKKMIRFTNRQNATLPADFRSNDPVQRRLAAEFDRLGFREYTGARRGGATDKVTRGGLTQVSGVYAAQSLVAFHGDPGTAYHESGSIWTINKVYRRYFNEATSATHILLCVGLARAVDERRTTLRAQEKLTDAKQKQLNYLLHRGSTALLVAAIASAAPALLDECPDDFFRLRYTGGDTIAATALWRPVVEQVGPWLDSHLSPVLQAQLLRRPTEVRDTLHRFQEAVRPILEDGDGIRAAFVDQVEVYQG